MPSRIANEVYLNTVRPLIGSHYPPEYHSFMYAADLGKLPRSNERVENYMFYDSSNGSWHCVMPIMLVTRTVIIDSAAITITGSGFSNDGSLNALNGGSVNYGWLTATKGTLFGESGTGDGGGVLGTASATWTAGSKTLTVTSVTGSPAVGATIFFQATTAQRVARATPNTFGVTAVSVASGSGTFTMSHAPTESGSGSITLYARRPLSQISQLLYCNSAGEPYLVYGQDFSTGGELGASGFPINLPSYDTAADNSLLGSESGATILYGDFPESGESWGGASSYPIVNNCCVVDRTGGGNRGQGKALALIWSFPYNNISPAEVRDRLQGVRFLVTIRHRSSVTGGKGG